MSLPGTILHAILIISIIFVLPLSAEETPANSADSDNPTDTEVSETTQASPGLSPPYILTPDLSLSDLEIVEQVRGERDIRIGDHHKQGPCFGLPDLNGHTPCPGES